MLTVDFARLPVGPGERVLDLGSGGGRHAFEMLRRGADVVAVDRDPAVLSEVAQMVQAMRAAGEVAARTRFAATRADARRLPFADGSFQRVVAAEVFEHIRDDAAAMAELVRVLAPGGLVAVTVPRWWPEQVCWALSRQYHEVEGGHVRIYRRSALVQRMVEAGLEPFGYGHAHALHSPYWWIKCAVGVSNDRHPLAAGYHRLLVWDITRRPWLTRAAESSLNPVLGKSLVVYARRPVRAAPPAPPRVAVHRVGAGR
jgi:SAM-dependent methyltransferase